ncbi:MAG: KUP/HAK/KT family potassium transporter [Polynucleobacter sp.]
MQTNLSNKRIYTLALAALGIVYGDIGTSPLYAFEQVFSGGLHPVPTSEANILGVLSLFFWCLVMVVTVKYVSIVMRANHAGEGGIIALMRILLEKSHGRPIIKGLLIFSGLVGAAFFYGDGVITPAISVLSAVEGMEVISPSLKSYVIPVALSILVGLFWGQRFGTGKIGILFGPAMLIWFVLLGALGLLNIVENPHVLLAMRPIYAQEFVSNNGLLPFFALGAVVLCVTGAEALYADMGHFGPKPIKLAWIGFVLPALLLNYFGQGALLLKSPESLSNLFYLMAPSSFHVAFVIFATFATVIASQAVISGAFSITRQAIDLGFLPKMRVVQTSQHDAGQIYVPAINLMLLIMVVLAVLLFKSSTALAGAYGIAVTGTMLLTDFLGISVAIVVWRWHPIAAMMGGIFFILMDLAFFTSNSIKFFDGGWFPLGMSVILSVVMALVFWRSKNRGH